MCSAKCLCNFIKNMHTPTHTCISRDTFKLSAMDFRLDLEEREMECALKECRAASNDAEAAVIIQRCLDRIETSSRAHAAVQRTQGLPLDSAPLLRRSISPEIAESYADAIVELMLRRDLGRVMNRLLRWIPREAVDAFNVERVLGMIGASDLNPNIVINTIARMHAHMPMSVGVPQCAADLIYRWRTPHFAREMLRVLRVGISPLFTKAFIMGRTIDEDADGMMESSPETLKALCQMCDDAATDWSERDAEIDFEALCDTFRTPGYWYFDQQQGTICMTEGPHRVALEQADPECVVRALSENRFG